MSVPTVTRSAAGLYLTPLQLATECRRWAYEVEAGRFRAHIDPDSPVRWHRRLHRDRRVDVWLISWLPTQGTQLHDHGGSSGAFAVLSGELTETVVSNGESVDFRREAGAAVCFGGRYVHDVRNMGAEPAVSVHAYSAPLTAMNYYDLRGGELVQIGSLATDDPEAEFPEPAAGGRTDVVRQAS